MRKKDLLEYAENDMKNISNSVNNVIKRGHVENAKDLYPDIELPRSIGYARGLVPLPFLVLLYDKIVIYIPPVSKEKLENRFQTSLSMILKLIESKLIQPLIGHPTYYKADYFSPILETHPPSIWARGLGLLHALGMEEKLNEKHCPLPIDEMAQLPIVRNRFRNYVLETNELTEKIKLDLLTNYADLWIFGNGDIADSLSLYKKRPIDVVNKLFLANEIRTYPVLFGLGGTANYDLYSLKDDPSLIQSSRITTKALPLIIPKNLDILLKGIGIKIKKMKADEIVKFHFSGYGKNLREAVLSFEKEAGFFAKGEGDLKTYNFYAAAENFQKAIYDASKLLSTPSYQIKLKEEEKQIRLLFRAGVTAVGGMLGSLIGGANGNIMNSVILGSVGAGIGIINQILSPEVTEKIVDAIIKKQFTPGIANLWKIIKGREYRD